MAQVTMKRSGRSITVSDKLARALVKGRYAYDRRDMSAEPIELIELPVKEMAAVVEPEATSNNESKAAAPEKDAASTKRAYKRRDMQAK